MRNKTLLRISAVALGQLFLVGCAADQTVQVKSLESLRKVERLAVLPFADGPGHQGKNSGQAVAGFIIGKAAQTKKFKVVERSKIQAVMGEKDLQISSIVDPSTAAKFGKLLGVDAVIIGSVSEYDHHRGMLPLSYVTIPTSEYTVSATLRIVSVSNGEVIYAASSSGKSGTSFAQAGMQLADKLLNPILN